MSDCVEVLFVSDGSGHLQTASCFDPHIGTTLLNYKGGGGVARKTLNVIGNDYLLSADSDKPLLHAWPLHSQEPLSNLRMVVAGKVSALSVSPDGVYCIAGIDSKIYIWEISSGRLLNVIQRHYQNISNIKFTDDSTHFITGGEDGIVLVWRLAQVVAKQTGSIFLDVASNAQPVYNFAHHSLPVTDLYLGHGNIKARLFTVSADQTCKVYSLVDGSLLLSIVFSYSLTSVVANGLETELFAGTSCGKIFAFSLDPYPRNIDHHAAQASTDKQFLGHSLAITHLSTSVDGKTLASGSDDSKVIIWDIPSRQLIRTFQMKGPITSVFFRFSTKNIFSNTLVPRLILSKFERVSKPEENDFEVNLLVPADLTPYVDDFEQTSKVKQLENEDNGEEMANLKQEVKKLKEINKQLYKFAMGNILKNPSNVDFETTKKKLTNGSAD